MGSSGDTTRSVLRCLENLPIIGHGIALCYVCANKREKAEKAGLKATVGILMAPLNFPAEIVDEIIRKRSPKINSPKLSPRPDWMKYFAKRTLRSLCLPASHQSGTSAVGAKLSRTPLAQGWTKCQKLSIEQQLLGGVRFFDIRLMSYKADVWLHHNVVTCVKFREVLDMVRTFITDNPSEIVFLHLSNDSKELNWGNVRTCLQEYLRGRMIPEHMRELRIGDILDQGKNVVIIGVPELPEVWQGLRYHWPNKQWVNELKEDLEQCIEETGIEQPFELFWYKAECTPGNRMIIRSIGGLPGALAARGAQEKFDFIEDMASAVNHCVLEVLRSVRFVPFNALSTDFISDEILARIIDLNASPDNPNNPNNLSMVRTSALLSTSRISGVLSASHASASYATPQPRPGSSNRSSGRNSRNGNNKSSLYRIDDDSTVRETSIQNISSYDITTRRSGPPIEFHETTM